MNNNCHITKFELMASSPTISIDAIDAIDEENFKLLDKLGNFEINNTGFEDDPDLMQAMISSTFYLEKKTVSMNIYMISKFIANIIGGGMEQWGKMGRPQTNPDLS